jgi:hypothetical protein
MARKRSRWVAFLFLVIALIAVLAIGLYRSVTHQDVHPVDSSVQKRIATTALTDA